MTLHEVNTSTGEAFADRPAPASPGATAAWWIGAFSGALALLLIIIALTRSDPAPLAEPAPSAASQPTGITIARSTQPAGPLRDKPRAVSRAENATRQAMNQDQTTYDSLVFPPTATPNP